MRALLVAVLALAGCQTAVPEQLGVEYNPADHMPDDYPPRIGGVAAVLNGQGMIWNTYNYSIGAFDSSVQVRGYGDAPEFHLMAETEPSSRSNSLVMKATMQSKLQTGALQAPLIELIAGEDMNGTRLTTAGGSVAEIVVDEITVDPEHEVLGHIKGHFSASLCAAEPEGENFVVDRGTCQTISGSFDSSLQFTGF